MKAPGVLAVLLSASLPTGAFAQNISAAARAGASAEAGVAGAIGTIQTAPSLIGGMPALTLSPSSLTPLLSPAPSLSLAPSVAPMAALAIPVAVTAAVPESARPAAAAPAAFSAVPAKSETTPATTWTEKLAAMFDGFRAKKAEIEPVEPGALEAYVVEHGKPMRKISLAEAYAHSGPVRLLSAKKDPSGLTPKHSAQVEALVGRKIQREEISIDWSAKAAEENGVAAAPAPAPAEKGLKAALLWPFREAKFLAKAFKASMVRPETSEIIGGFATKTFPLVTSIGVFWATVGLAHPFVLAALIGLNVAQEVFHGFFLKTWNNFQKELLRGRGFNYQMFFNLAYMQGAGTLYRLLSWTANPKNVTPPWSPRYWGDIAVMSLFGTFFGVLGYNSLNALYDKGVIKRWQHSGIQQVRDLCFLLAAPFFASGSMTVFWSIFIFQQLLDLAIGLWAGRMAARPIVFVTSAPVAASAEFAKQYPVAGLEVVPPVKQAVTATINNPITRLLTWPFRAAWKAVRGGPQK